MPAVLDVKCGAWPAWGRMQLAAYIEFGKYPTTSGRMAGELHGDGTYRSITIPVRQHTQDFNDFCCCLRVFTLKREFNQQRERQAA